MIQSANGSCWKGPYVLAAPIKASGEQGDPWTLLATQPRPMDQSGARVWEGKGPAGAGKVV
jgi:hypothetical protein